MFKSIRQISSKQLLHTYKICFYEKICQSEAANYSTQPAHQNIFDRNAKRLQKERAALNPDVELYDYLKEEVGFRLADRIIDIKREFTNAADIGCSRGFLSKHIMAESVRHLTLCDTSPTMLAQAQGTPGLKLTKLELDEEKLDEYSYSFLITH
uniref:Putative methyltransferase C20orf7, mitochondrial n=1 Tax=Bactrocera latifrons TaxID=174628 RepID=A0A0K8UTA6_BACLA